MAVGNIIQLHPSSLDSANREETKKKVSELLKRADQLIRKGELELAQNEITKAKELDPKNAYSLALEERIISLKSEIDKIEKSTQSKDTSKIVKGDATPDNTTENTKISADSNTANISTLPQDIKKTKSSNASKQSYVVTDENVNQSTSNDRQLELETYTTAMANAWADGALSESENRQLSELRALLEITEAEHKKIEKTVKIECYKNAVMHNLKLNPNVSLKSKTFAELRRSYQISDEEHQQIQKQILNSINKNQREKILLIDDDIRLLELLQVSLEDNGYEVVALSTSDEAYALLRKFKPDLILCDINLETSAMGGFTFYEKIQEYKHIQDVPFIFLTGLTDEALMYAGKELGVDDYLKKPITERMLISALRGKLKRFKQLKSSSSSSKSPATK